MTRSFVASLVVQYFLLPLVLLGLATPWLLRAWGRTPQPRALWGLMTPFVVIGGVMASLRYLAYRTAFHDLGVYDQRIWQLSQLDVPTPLAVVEGFGHFSPILIPHVLLYRLCPSALVLIWAQVIAVAAGAYPLYRLAERHLGPRAALAFAAAYLLYPSIVFKILMDFHPDHLVLPLLLFAFDALDRGSTSVALLWALAILLVKETMAPTAIAFGLYALIARRRYVLGVAVVGVGLALFVLVIEPRYSGAFRTEIGTMSYGYLGSSIPQILRTVVLSPTTWIVEVVKLPKLHFLFLMLAPLAFLPLFAPSVLLVAIPGFALALLSQWGARYQIWTQYVNPMIPPLFVAAIFGHERLLRSPRWNRLLGRPGNADRLLAGWLLGTAVYWNVLLSPSPISTTFWLGYSGSPSQTRWAPGAVAPIRTGQWLAWSEWVRWPFHWTAYVVGPREREIRAALDRYVPADPTVSVSVQNNLNSSHLAHRFEYVEFPELADYVVLDTHRPAWLMVGIDAATYAAELASLSRQRPLVHAADGLMIFGPKAAPAERR